MHLAKPALDVGVFTTRPDEARSFWSEIVGLSSQPMLKLGGGVHQYRFIAGASVIKVNHARHPLAASASGIAGVGLVLAGGDDGSRDVVPLRDPDGALVLRGRGRNDDVSGLFVRLAVSDVPLYRRFWASVLGLPVEGDTCLCGNTRITLHRTTLAPAPQSWQAIGWSYLTVQVHDCIAEHAALLERGATLGAAPKRLGDQAVISFIRDPDGNFIEISQKAELVGGLPPAT